jgi:CheY-like chemotaxis protein
MKCPRCQALVSAPPDASGVVVCPTCGARLRSKPPAPAPEPRPAPPMPAPAPRPPSPPPVAPVADVESTLVSARKPKAAASSEAAAPASALTEQVLAELRALREGQEEILSLLRSGGAARTDPVPAFGGFTGPTPPSSEDEDVPAVPPPVVRSRRRKTVLLMDDDEAQRAEAQAALEKAEVPVRVVADGNAGLAAIAEQKPDVIVLELDMGGSMAGKDVVNMIKATMEWIDIPIVLYTRLPIDGQKEARQIHGADELVRKGEGSADALVSRVISVFRRG